MHVCTLLNNEFVNRLKVQTVRFTCSLFGFWYFAITGLFTLVRVWLFRNHYPHNAHIYHTILNNIFNPQITWPRTIYSICSLSYAYFLWWMRSLNKNKFANQCSLPSHCGRPISYDRLRPTTCYKLHHRMYTVCFIICSITWFDAGKHKIRKINNNEANEIGLDELW